MSRRPQRRFQPTLGDVLEGRDLPSAVAAQVSTAPRRPRVSVELLKAVHAEIDAAFDAYRGKTTVGGWFSSTIDRLIAGDNLSDALHPTQMGMDATRPMPKGPTDKYNGSVLIRRVAQATSHLPAARTGFTDMVSARLSAAPIRPNNAVALQRWVKQQVRVYVAGLR